MSISFNERTNIFTLNTDASSYQMKIDEYGFLLHLYYGEKVTGDMDYMLVRADRGFSGNPYCVGTDRTYSLDTLPQEIPYWGSGDYRSPSLIVKNHQGIRGCNLRYKDYHIYKGKYTLEHLPAVYGKECDAETLEIIMEDTFTNIDVCLLYSVFPAYDVITRAVRIENKGQMPVIIEKLHSATIDFLYGNFDMISFYGRHVMERQLQRQEIRHGSYIIGSRRGTSSHQYQPFIMLADQNANETQGHVYAMSFVYSGGFKSEIEKDQFNHIRVQMGLQDEGFEYKLDIGEVLTGPEVVMSFSSNGFETISHHMHDLVKYHICRVPDEYHQRPVLVNSWESAYFNIDANKIIQLADDAKALGLDMVVMDDGWFGKRDCDDSSLGDWFVNESKLGMSLKEMVDRIHEKDIKFGIWFEPEAVSEESILYRNHPDWALQIPGLQPNRSRYQLLLDFSRKEVVDNLFDQICRILDSVKIDYVKWDMNRSMTDLFTGSGKLSGTVSYDYIIGLYSLLERLHQRYPDILIEGCSGGGGRYDLGMLYYTPQIWCSDNTDAIDRLKIQYGTSFIYPSSTMAAHVSAVPNHQTGRVVSMNTRGIVAMAGMLGYELTLSDLDDKEKAAVRKQILNYHQYESLILDGLYYRLTSPYDNSICAWAYASRNHDKLLVSVVDLKQQGNRPFEFLKLRGLLPGRYYRVLGTDQIYPADGLMQYGFPLPQMNGDYTAWQMCFELINEFHEGEK